MGLEFDNRYNDGTVIMHSHKAVWILEYEAAQNIVPIPIRADLIVRIHGIPLDMTETEAEKIGAVVKALAVKTGYR
jgi:hypothetical protein